MDGWNVLYSVIVDMLTDGTIAKLLPEPPDGPPGLKPPPWPGFDAWLNQTPDWLFGNDGATLTGFDPETWGNDVSDFAGWGDPVPGWDGGAT
jgi:hypothetical protein